MSREVCEHNVDIDRECLCEECQAQAQNSKILNLDDLVDLNGADPHKVAVGLGDNEFIIYCFNEITYQTIKVPQKFNNRRVIKKRMTQPQLA